MKGKVTFTKKNEIGMYGFIACEDGTSHYFDTSTIIRGNYITTGSHVEFDVIPSPSRNGKTQAINVRLENGHNPNHAFGKVSFTKKNERGMYGFIACEDGSSHYFDTSSIIHGNYIKYGSDVEFDIIPSPTRSGKTQAINIQLADGKLSVSANNEQINQEDLELLSEHYSNKNFFAVLTSNFLKSISFSELPLNYMEMVLTCAERLVHPNSDKIIKIGEFLYGVLSSPTSEDFINNYRGATGFTPSLVASFSDVSFSELTLPVDTGRIYKALNKIGLIHTDNSYAGLTKRIAISYSYILPLLFFVRACTNPEKIENCLKEYCQIVKNVKHSDFNSKLRQEKRMLEFSDLIIAINNYLLDSSDFSAALNTNILSTYIDCADIGSYLVLDHKVFMNNSPAEKQVVALLESEQNWTEEHIVNILSKNVSKQLFQKSLALLWEKYKGETILPLPFLKMLGWTCVHDNFTSLDEVLRWHYSNSLSKTVKQVQLLESFDSLQEYAEKDISLYALASYISNIVFQDVNNTKIPEEAHFLIPAWIRRTGVVLSALLSPFNNASCIPAESFKSFLVAVSLEESNSDLLQSFFANKHRSFFSLDNHTAEEVEADLDILFFNNAFVAFLEEYDDCKKRFGTRATNIRIEQICESYINLHRFSDALTYLHHDDTIDPKLRIRLVIKTITENFRINALSPKAFSIFNAFMSCEDSINLLQANISDNSYGIINSLIALFCNKGEYEKALYLSSIYGKKAENGFTRLYSQFRSRVTIFSGRCNQHYDAIQIAFHSLSRQDLVDFLSWASKIPVPKFSGYQPYHVFSRFFDSFIGNPQITGSWMDFLSHVRRRMDMNSWLVVVLESILKYNFNQSLPITREAIIATLDQDNINSLPFNLLLYVFPYIIETDDEELVHRVLDFVKKEGVKDKLITKNLWFSRYEKELLIFKTYAMSMYSKTGKQVYFEIIAELGLKFETSDMTTIAQMASDKRYLIVQLSKNYLSGQQISESIELLNGKLWTNLTYRDSEAIKLLRTIFNDDEILLLSKDNIFDSEEDVRRFKLDCAYILCTYPGKKGLFDFYSSCRDEAHKLVVLSAIIPITYDEDIYKEIEHDYLKIKGNDKLYRASVCFFRQAYYAQLEWNKQYDFFYHKWRYLKMYLANFLLRLEDFDDSTIVETMHHYRHFDQVYHSDYEPFVLGVKKCWEQTHLSFEAKRSLLFCIMVGQTMPFIESLSAELHSLDVNDKNIICNLITQLDYRQAALCFYQFYSPFLEAGHYEEAVSASDAVSPYCYDAIKALKENANKIDLLELYHSIALEQTPTKVVFKAFSLPPSSFEAASSLILPLICSRQLLFHIYGFMRLSLVNPNKIPLTYFRALCEYLESRGHLDAMPVYKYLVALDACIKNDLVAAKEIIRKWDLHVGIPYLWNKEADNIIRFAIGESNQLELDSTISDNSLTKKAEIHYSFGRRLQALFEIPTQKITAAYASTLYGKYIDASVPLWDRLQAGSFLLCNYPDVDKKQLEKNSIPKKEDLMLSVGINSLLPAINLSADDKLLVLTDLYHNRMLFSSRKQKEQLETIAESLLQLLSTNIPLKAWIIHCDSIDAFLKDRVVDSEFGELKHSILDKNKDLFSADISVEERHERLLALLQSLNPNMSIYARYLYSSIQNECKQIEEGARLSIKIESDHIIDGYVYFFIENIGTTSVSLSDCEVLYMGTIPISLENSISILHPHTVTGGRVNLTTSEADMIELQVRYGSTLLCKDSVPKQELDIPEKTCAIQLNADLGDLYPVDKAVKVFGREAELERLIRLITKKGKALIFGPSRIGKTSILDSIRDKYAAKQPNVISVTFACEGSAKLSDYESIPETATDDEIEERLLIGSILKAFTEKGRRLQLPAESDQMTGSEIISILHKDLPISARYSSLNDYLQKKDLYLWLILDEFQQIISKWTPKITGAFAKICLDTNEDSRVKLIVCGSDDLLKHMVLKRESCWRALFDPLQYVVQVKAINKAPFLEMLLCEPLESGRTISEIGLKYSEPAKAAIFQYTGGIPLYGKHLCNQVLTDLAVSGDCKLRDTIFSADISKAAQILINSQQNDSSGAMRKIYDEVTKNLDKETDDLFLSFIANYMATENKEGCPYSAFTHNSKGEFAFWKEGTQPFKVLDDSLAIAEARGIIRKVDPKALNPVYTFCTVFYYSAFLGNALSDRYLYDKLFLRINDQTEEFDEPSENPYEYHNLIRILPDLFEKYTTKDQKTLLGSLVLNSDSTVRESIREIAGTNVGGDLVKGDKVFQITVQNMTNAFTMLLSGDVSSPEYLKAFSDLPSLHSFIPESTRPQLEEKIKELHSSDNQEKQQIIETEIEALTAPAEQSVVGAALAAATDTSSFFFLPEARWEDLIHVSKEKIEKAVPPEFFSSLGFAVLLQNVFETIRARASENEDAMELAENDLDYCPIAIMYCKIVEAMLKELHTPIYVERLEEASIGKSGRKFIDLVDENGIINKADKELSIGSFAYSIVFTDKNNTVDEPDSFHRRVKKDNIRQITGDIHDYSDINKAWHRHALELSVIRGIRNKSAHDAAPITRENFEWLIETLFERGEFLRIAELSRRYQNQKQN